MWSMSFSFTFFMTIIIIIIIFTINRVRNCLKFQIRCCLLRSGTGHFAGTSFTHNTHNEWRKCSFNFRCLIFFHLVFSRFLSFATHVHFKCISNGLALFISNKHCIYIFVYNIFGAAKCRHRHRNKHLLRNPHRAHQKRVYLTRFHLPHVNRLSYKQHER